MPLHFQWILTCPDKGTSFTLTKDPANWADCSYTLQRHSTYMGIFNQFTSSLKFHAEGGGKQFIDGIYQQYDIDGNIYIQINIDNTGTGQTYDALFNGRLNLASYSTDGTFTTVNVEASDIVYKLNTRADIPVPVNVLSIPAGYYTSGDNPSWISYSFSGIILDTYTPVAGESSYVFTDPLIVQGKTYYAQTFDPNFNPLTAQIVFDGVNNNTNGTQSFNSGALTLGFSVAGTGQNQELLINFNGLSGPVILYQQGTQLSLGQQPVTPVPSQIVSLPGIPVLYESQFSLADAAVTFSSMVITLPASGTFPYGIISVCTEDINGYNIYDQVNWQGASVAGTGMTATNGLTAIQILGISSTSITVKCTNAYGVIDIYTGSIGNINVASPNGGTAPGTVIYTYSLTANAPAQQFQVQPSSAQGIDLNTPLNYEGFIGFDAITLFDNLDEFVGWGRFCDIANPVQSTQTTTLPPICLGITGAYIEEPVQVNWSVVMQGSLTEQLGANANEQGIVADRNVSIRIILAHGGGEATGATTPFTLAVETGAIVLASSFATETGHGWTFNFDINQSGSFNLNVGDSIWFYAYIKEDFTTGGGNNTVIVPLTWNFVKTLIDFQVIEIAPPTTAETIMVHEALNQVVDMIADSDGNFVSNFYGRTNSAKITYPKNGSGSLRALTNGLCIRGHLDKPILLSLNDIFNSMNAIDNIGLSINANNKVQVEPLAFFFNPNALIATLPFVNTFETTNENSYYLNQVEVGYNKWETEIYFRNGLDEIHASRNFGTKVGAAKGTILQNYQSNTSGFLRIANKLSALSSFVAGNYTIELTREKNLAWSHDDFKYDNDNFIICMNNVYRGLAYFNTGNSFTIEYYLAYTLLPGDTFTVTGTASNNNTYSINRITANPGVPGLPDTASTTIFVNESFVTEQANAAVLTFASSLFPEFAKDILQQPIANVIDPALSELWLNMSITPARMLQAQMNRITAGLQTINGKVQFLGASGNFQAATQMFPTGAQQDYTGKTLYENASLNWNDANARNITPLWLPEIYKFEYPLTYQQFRAILANPNGYINFYKFTDDVKQGFILSMDYNLKSGMAQFTLLKMYNANADNLMITEDGRVIGTEGTVSVPIAVWHP